MAQETSIDDVEDDATTIDRGVSEARSDESAPRRSITAHKTGQPWKCDQCSYIGRMAHSLNQHIRRCHTVRKHLCTLCDKSYSYKCDLQKHTNMKHSNTAAVLCDLCGEGFSNEASRQRHKELKHDMLTHDNPMRKFECHICKSRFLTRANLEGHINKHLNMKPYKCKNCDAVFNYVTSQRNHERECQIKEKVHKCQICSKYFRTKKCLKAHHSGMHAKYGHVCTVCDKCFKWKSNLARHMKKHTLASSDTNVHD